MENRLAYSSSPYLLQHKENPVHWFEWNAEAFETAKRLNKPIFLSIGYATCHWCHVMAHESFEDQAIAELLNDAFINIKVDREERPDIDSTYMTVCQLITGQGGWPLTIVMTPDKKPFFAATYIPKEARFGRLGLRQLIPGIKGMWEHEPDRIQKAVDQISSGFAKTQHFEAGAFPGTEAIDFAAEQLIAQFDPDFGGFGSEPKFPSPHNLMFLLRQFHHTKEEKYLESVVHTLTQMRLGGIWDHVGFGFHRYSTDREWLLPHFEKMLYDQALLMMAYTEAWQITKNPLFEQTVYEIADYVKRELTHQDGGFYSAEDADSEGEEGKFYVWEFDEIETLCENESFEFIQNSFNIDPEGNFKDEASKQLTGKNILHLSAPFSKAEAIIWDRIRPTLFEQRSKRIRPLLDDKILTDWNGMMIAALAKAGVVFNNNEFLEAGIKAYQFVQDSLNQGQLYHRFKDNEIGINGFADDYAFLIWAGIELHHATLNSSYLLDALSICDKMNSTHWDSNNGGYWLSVNDEDQVLGRQKQIYDGAIPSSNSIMFLNLLKLSKLTGNVSFETQADEIGKLFSTDLIRSGSSITMGMMGLQFVHFGSNEVVIVEGNEPTREIEEYLSSRFLPNHVLLKKKDSLDLSEVVGYTKNLSTRNGKSQIFICKNFTCDLPLTSLEELRKKIES